jgi:hypothetical protein
VPDDVEPGGNWDLNNVQLFATPCFVNPAVTNGQFSACFKSPPGLTFQILGSTNLSQTNWTYLSTVTNATGSIFFQDPAANQYPQRFYQAQQVP